MRALLVALIVLVVLAEPTFLWAQPESIGEGEDENAGCLETPAACIGAGTALPIDGSAASTLPDPGCIANRIVTPEAGGQSDSFPVCPDVDGDGIADVPAPPTHAEIVAQICPAPPAAVLGHNPREFGITGWHTWLWSAGDVRPRTANGEIRFYPVACRIEAVRFDFDSGDPHAAKYGHQRRYSSTEPGGEREDTPVQHFWEVKGTYTLSHTVTWVRTTSVGSDRTARTTTLDHQVKEVVAGMTSADG